MDRGQRKQELLRFLHTVERPGHTVEDADEGLNLIESGYIDSLAVIQIITWLETNQGVSLADLGIDPATLSTIGGILDIVERSSQ